MGDEAPRDGELTYTCVVCGGAATAPMSAECNWCDGRYHLNQRNDVEAQDCGEVWIDEQFLALQFACANCLAETRGQSPRADSARKASAASTPRPSPSRRKYRRRS